MRNERIAAARMVADKLLELETAIDDALVCAAELTTATSKARRDVNASTVVGQKAMSKTGETISALYAAHRAIAEAHGGFAEVRDEMRIPPQLGGRVWKDGPPPAFGEQQAHLKAV